MDIAVTRNIVRAFTARFLSVHPEFRYLQDDFKSEAWLHAVSAARSWKPGGCKYSTYLWTRLKWLWGDWIDHGLVEQRVIDLSLSVESDEIDLVTEPTQYAALALSEVGEKLSDQDKILLALILCPDDDFIGWVRANDRGNLRGCNIGDAHYAKYLGIPRRSIARSRARICDLLKDAIDGLR